MTKLFSALILTAFAFGAQAASHAGGAPMKDKAASAPAAAASAAKKDAKNESREEGRSQEVILQASAQEGRCFGTCPFFMWPPPPSRLSAPATGSPHA